MPDQPRLDPSERYKRKEDICAHLGDDYERFLGAISPPIFQTTLFTRKSGDSGYSYSRTANPTVEIVERKLAALEEGERAICVSSGMAAISSAVLHCIERDAHIVALQTVYPDTKALLDVYLRKFGVEVTYVPGTSMEDFDEVCGPDTRVIYLESPSSMVYTMVDLEPITEFARSRGIITIMDNTWATPLFQNPLRFGVDIVVHSCTKYLGGHSDVTGGVAVGKADLIEQIAAYERTTLGCAMDPHQAWLLLRGIRTLPVRMRQHQENALRVARFLESHSKVRQVLHPGLPSHPQYDIGRKQLSGYSGLLSFVPTWELSHAEEFMHGLDCFQVGPSWGGYESLIELVDSGLDETTAAEMGLPMRLFRLSVGLESAETLIEALDRALGAF
jgi:cystathionine beta-lyase/cystathionine gamma-synthase